MTLARLIEAQRGLVMRLDEFHRIAITAKGRNPDKYVSSWSLCRDEAAAILRAMEGRDE